MSRIKTRSQQSTNARFFLSNKGIQQIKLKNKGPKRTHLAM